MITITAPSAGSKPQIVDFRDVTAAENKETGMVRISLRLDKDEITLFQAQTNAYYRAFFRYIYYYEDGARLEALCETELDFCSYKFRFDSIIDIMLFLEQLNFSQSFLFEGDDF